MPSLIPDLPVGLTPEARTKVLYREQLEANYKKTDRRFAGLMAAQWLAGIAAAVWISPTTWIGQYSHTHIHVWAAIFLGGMISGFPIYLVLTRPGSQLTRHVIAIGQMLTSGLLVHLTGGRIETHFHYFGSLAFLAFYRDWRVLMTATIVVASDHFIRGVFWPESIFGVLAASHWRWLEHAGWVVFEDVFLLMAIRQNLQETHGVAERQAKLETINATIEKTVAERTRELKDEIVERQRVEDTLRESEEKFRQMADNIDDVFWITSPDLKEIHYISPAYEHVWGRAVESLYADPHQWVEAILPEEREHAFTAIASLMANASEADVEYRIARPDGGIRWIHDRGYQVKDGSGKVIRLTGIASDITERKKAEAERTRLAAILESTTDMVGTADPTGYLLYLNRAGRSLLGIGLQDDISNAKISDFHPDPDNHPVMTEGLATALRQGAWSGEVTLQKRSGQHVPVSQVILSHKATDGTVEFFSTIVRDMSERKRFEAKLFQSQKMETVGKLAGGIAHEFNSILTAIIGQSELMLDRLPDGSPICESATEIIQAADRAAALTRQLLAYGRKQILQPEPLNLNKVVANMESLLHNLMGSDVQIQIADSADIGLVKADLGQIEQVITNVAMNAHDAMPNGGRLTLETTRGSIDADSVGDYSDLKSGNYVVLSITDTGVGMNEEVKSRAFEPFFTTKNVGQGTGLGLSTSYGIIKQSGGHMSAYSELGRGTTIRILLPELGQSKTNSTTRASPEELPRGTETILVVEDDPALRTMAQTVLKRLGYTVHAAANGVEALNLKQQSGIGHIDLLFTDVVMPHMSGKELADRVRSLFPHTKILFTSAYAENAIVHQGVLDEGVALLQKPFKAQALAKKLREVLDR